MLTTYLPTASLLIAAVLCHVVSAEARTSRLPRSTPETEGVDSKGVLAFVDALEKKIDAVHSFMLVRHGKVVAEGWWSPYRAEDAHIMYSVSKSFAATAVGFAAQEKLLSLTDTIVSRFPDLAPKEPHERMKEMRVHDLLRMATGHDQNPPIKDRKDGAWVKAFLETEVEHKPGTHFVYNSSGSYVLSALVQKVSGKSLEEYLRPRLFEPLGIEAPRWGKSPEGVNLGDGGMMLRTEDLAKFGLLYLQKGVWNGKRLLSEAWVNAATSLQTSTGGNPDSNWDAGYGYQFWRNKVTGYRADGAFGQFSFVLPEHDAVLAVTSGTSDMHGVMNAVWEHVLPALHGAALPSAPASVAALAAKLESLSLPVQAGEKSSARAEAVSGREYRLEANEQGLTSASVDFSGKDARVTLADAGGKHVISCGHGRWVRGTTGYQSNISNVFDDKNQPVAASCAWLDDKTFAAKLCFNETPYTVTARLSFDGDQLLLDVEHNLRWGETKRPRVTGRRA